MIEAVPSKLGMPEDNWNAYNSSMQNRVVAETMKRPDGADLRRDEVTEEV